MTEHRLADLVDLYLLRCDVEGKSPRTVCAYRWTLARFLRALREDGAPADPRAIEREHVYGYLGRFTELAADTRHRYLRLPALRTALDRLVSTATRGAGSRPPG